MRASVILSTIAILVILPFLSQIPGCVMAMSAKSGTVVDADTGEALRDAIVVSSGHFSATSILGPSASGIVHRETTLTDADGHFYLPMHLNHFSAGLPGTDFSYVWTVTAVKPGYAVDGDEKAIASLNQEGATEYVPQSRVISPAARWSGVARLSPIKLRRQLFTLRQWTLYWASLLYVGFTEPWQQTVGEKDIQRELRESLMPMLCAPDPQAVLDYHLTSYLLVMFAPDTVASARHLADLDPVFAEMGHRENARYQSSHVCEAMKDIGSQKVY